jgi:hypothetical protein
MEINRLLGDKEQQESGTWVTHETGAEFKIVYSESKVPRDYVAKRMSKARMKSRKAFVSGEVMAEITLDLLVDHIVLDWKNITNNGEPYEYSKEHCRWLLENSPILRDFIAIEAQDAENFGIDLEPEASAKGAGKSERRAPSPGAASES